MKITLFWIGKTDEPYLRQGTELYESRIGKYLDFQAITIPDVRKGQMTPARQSELEATALLEKISPRDDVFLLDERGEMFSSAEMARFLEKKMLESTRNLVFVIGGPYGFHEKLYQRAQGTISLSRMTFSHQMVRLLFLEQLYRALTIIRGEPYHHA
jgi:23S rRNA (pseudouridine1915-N3)-methyltransferase